MSDRLIHHGNYLNLLKSLLQSESAVSLYFQRILILLESLEVRELKTDKRHAKIIKKAKFHINTILKTVEENRRILTRKIDLIMGDELQDQEPWCLVQTISMPSYEVHYDEVPINKDSKNEVPMINDKSPTVQKIAVIGEKLSEVNAQVDHLEKELPQTSREGTPLKVAVLTMFSAVDKTNQVVQVVAEQIKMLLDAKLPTKILVSNTCLDSDRYGIFTDERLEWIKIKTPIDQSETSRRSVDHSGDGHEYLFHHAKIISADLVDKLLDTNICIIHDILSQEEHLLNNLAVRIAQKELKNVKFIAMSHSLPGKRPAVINSPYAASYTPMPKTVYVHSTYAGLPALANQYQVPEGKCRVVNYSFDVLAELSGEVKSIASQVELLSPDFLIMYPAPLNLEKQFERVVLFAGALSRVSEKTVKIVFCDFPNSRIDSSSFKEKIVDLGVDVGLGEAGIVFTSDLGYSQGLTKQSILDLFTLSNLYVCPSFSENFGLTVFEAASRGNFLVLNEAVPTLAEIGKNLNAYFVRWNARNFGFEPTSEQAYLEEHARNIVKLIREDRALSSKTTLRQRYSPKWIWKNHLEPLLDS